VSRTVLPFSASRIKAVSELRASLILRSRIMELEIVATSVGILYTDAHSQGMSTLIASKSRW
jgi:hypothetical protein